MNLKTYLSLAAAVLMVAACSDNKKCASSDECPATACTTQTDGDITYTGVLPAADAEGIEYTLVLNYDDDGDGGDYKLTERYIGKADAVFVSEGDFSLHSSTPQDAAQRYLKLVPDHADRAADQATSSAEVRYFLVDSDSTLTLVGADLQRPDSLLNYTLTRK